MRNVVVVIAEGGCTYRSIRLVRVSIGSQFVSDEVVKPLKVPLSELLRLAQETAENDIRQEDRDKLTERVMEAVKGVKIDEK
jgi:hypothetical protein